MNRCSPVETRKNLELAKNFASIGLDFVCVPVSGSSSKEQLVRIASEALEVLALAAEVEELKSNISMNENHIKEQANDQ